MNLTGIVGALIFLGMICLAVLLFIIALLLKLIGKKHFVFKKMSMVCIVLVVIGSIGIYMAQTNYDMQFRHNMDDYYGWISFLFASVLSLFILLKKNPNSPS